MSTDKRLQKIGKRRVEVTWVDATGHSGWMDLDRALTRRPIIMQTIGYLIEDTKTYIKLCRTIEAESQDTGDVGDVFTIPKGWIKRFKKL